MDKTKDRVVKKNHKWKNKMKTVISLIVLIDNLFINYLLHSRFYKDNQEIKSIIKLEYWEILGNFESHI